MDVISQLQTRTELLLSSTPHSNHIPDLLALADSWNHHSRPQKAIECYAEVINLQTTTQTDLPDQAETYIKKGNLHRKLGQKKETGTCYREAVALLERAYPNGHIDLAGLYHMVGAYLEQLMKLSLAQDYYQKSLTMLHSLDEDYDHYITPISNRLTALKEKQRHFSSHP